MRRRICGPPARTARRPGRPARPTSRLRHGPARTGRRCGAGEDGRPHVGAVWRPHAVGDGRNGAAIRRRPGCRRPRCRRREASGPSDRGSASSPASAGRPPPVLDREGPARLPLARDRDPVIGVGRAGEGRARRDRPHRHRVGHREGQRVGGGRDQRAGDEVRPRGVGEPLDVRPLDRRRPAVELLAGSRPPPWTSWKVTGPPRGWRVTLMSPATEAGTLTTPPRPRPCAPLTSTRAGPPRPGQSIPTSTDPLRSPNEVTSAAPAIAAPRPRIGLAQVAPRQRDRAVRGPASDLRGAVQGDPAVVGAGAVRRRAAGEAPRVEAHVGVVQQGDEGPAGKARRRRPRPRPAVPGDRPNGVQVPSRRLRLFGSWMPSPGM